MINGKIKLHTNVYFSAYLTTENAEYVHLVAVNEEFVWVTIWSKEEIIFAFDFHPPVNQVRWNGILFNSQKTIKITLEK